jgi:pyridoxal phosphate enzyme (YggS family)
MEVADLQNNLETARNRIAQACQRSGRSVDEVTLIAVTKTVDPPTLELAHRLGLRHFGENKVQEGEKKVRALYHLQPRPTWHMIGHLQSNKVKIALEVFDIIHSVDSIDLATDISRRTQKKTAVLLQVNVAAEATKRGFSLTEIGPAFEAITQLPNLEIQGLMTVAPLVRDPNLVRPVFRKLRDLKDSFHLTHLSMGMTDDFEVAIEEGATMIRLGRAIFGERN